MPLMPTTFYNLFEESFLFGIGVDDEGTVNRIDPDTGLPLIDLPKASGGEWSLGTLFANAYEAYAKEATILGLAPGSLSFNKQPLINVLDQGGTAVTLGEAFASFWGSTSGTQIPVHGGVAPITYVNNAGSMGAAFSAAITAAIQSNPTSISLPIFSPLMEKVDPVVRTILFTFTEANPPGSPVIGVSSPT